MLLASKPLTSLELVTGCMSRQKVSRGRNAGSSVVSVALDGCRTVVVSVRYSREPTTTVAPLRSGSRTASSLSGTVTGSLIVVAPSS